MNYSDQILENKTFNFFKQLMYNLALAVCIMLIGVLILVYVFKFNLYEVGSDSQAPYYFEHDLVVVKAQKEYKPGDIIKFDYDGLPTTHRLIYVLTEGDKTYYICHGDADTNLDTTETDFDWKDDSEQIRILVEEQGYTMAQLSSNYKTKIQNPTIDKIEGKVVAWMRNSGAYITFIKEHYMLFIALVAGVWCISTTVQNEMEIKRSLRLL